MKFSDRMKLAVHNMWTAKSRTILTIIIVFVVSVLIQVIGISCINFATNINTYMSKQLEESGSQYTINYTSENGSYNASEDKPTLPKDIVEILYTATKDDATALSISYRSNNLSVSTGGNSNLTAYDYRTPMTINNVVEGRGWTADDYDTNAVFIEKKSLEKLNSNYSTNYAVGDNMSFRFYEYRAMSNKEFMVNCVIKGIFENPATGYSYNMPSVIFDSTYLTKNHDVTYTGAAINNPSPTSKNVLSTIIKYNKSLKKFNAVMPTVKNGKFEVSSSYIEENMMTIIINVTIIGLGLIIGFIVLLLSIGSIANTMIISIDKNKKFTGLMMAMGLKPKNIKSVIRLEGAMTIISGIILSTILCLAFIPVFNSVLGGLFDSLFFGEATFKFSFPFYFPIGVSIVFILMAMLFTKAGVSSLIKQDPITVISEVG